MSASKHLRVASLNPKKSLKQTCFHQVVFQTSILRNIMCFLRLNQVFNLSMLCHFFNFYLSKEKSIQSHLWIFEFYSHIIYIDVKNYVEVLFKD